MNFKPVYIEAVDLPDAWFQCVYNIFDHGFKYTIDHGSFVGNTRLEFDAITIYIKKPYSEPYDNMLPQIPAHYNIPNPVENGYVEQYLPYLMTGETLPNEEYTYGERLNNFTYWQLKPPYNASYDWVQFKHSQVEHFISLLKNTSNTNQAILQVGMPEDCFLEDPPCLRHIDMRIKDGQLIFYPYFRSNDLWGGFPANLAGIAVLQKYMADEIGVEVGPMLYHSKGLHLYQYVEELAKLRVGK